jgi:hypothetical protein
MVDCNQCALLKLKSSLGQNGGPSELHKNSNVQRVSLLLLNVTLSFSNWKGVTADRSTSVVSAMTNALALKTCASRPLVQPSVCTVNRNSNLWDLVSRFIVTRSQCTQKKFSDKLVVPRGMDVGGRNACHQLACG